MFGRYNQNGTSSYVEDPFQLNRVSETVKLSPEESKLKNKIKIVREEDKATWV